MLQDRALASTSRPASVYLSFSSLLYRAKAAALLVLVAWSLPLSLMLSALVVLRHCWRLFASGQGEALWQRVRGRLSGERRPNRGTALVSGECQTLPSQSCSEHRHLKAMSMQHAGRVYCSKLTVCLAAGAKSTKGLAVCRQLHRAGWRVILVDTHK